MQSQLFEVMDQYFQSQSRILEWVAMPISDADHAPDFEHLQAWLHREFHGDMAYMAKYTEQRQKPILMESWARSMVFFLWRYPTPLRQVGVGSTPKISSYAHGRDYHEEVKAFVFELAQQLSALDPDLQIRPFVDSAPVFERAWAKSLGLGWTGKNSCLIHSKFGSGFFIGGFFIDKEIVKTLKPQIDFCGKCTLCIDQCPTQAIVAPGQIDARKCISYLSIEKRSELSPSEGLALGEWIFGCDICQSVCPWNHKHLDPNPTLNSHMPETTDQWLGLLSKGGGFNSRFKGTPLMRAGRKQLMRNLFHYLRANSKLPSPTDLDMILADEDQSHAEQIRRIAQI